MKENKPAKKIKPVAPKRKLNLPDDEPLHLNMSFEQFVKKAATTPIKKSKINKK